MTPIASDIKTIECLFVACIRHYRYPLTGEERAVLRTRMDGYCMEQTGMGLEEHRSQYLAETDGPAQGPRM